MPIRTAKYEGTESRRRGIVATALAVAVLAGMLAFHAQPSFADSEVRNGDGASASFQSNDEKFRLWDTACDGRPVYLLYQLRTGAPQERHFNGGCRQMALYDLDFGEGQPIAYKACISIRFAPDDCSDVPGPATWAIDTT
jgi:hypothetical protein